MFDFLLDAGNYRSRMVGREPLDPNDPNGEFLVSTAAVSDGREPFETAVKHPDYNGGKMVIVECYPTREAAEAGHAKWVATMKAEPLPDSLRDCANAEVAQLLDALSEDKDHFLYPRRKSS
jgi:hypothetical protein